MDRGALPASPTPGGECCGVDVGTSEPVLGL